MILWLPLINSLTPVIFNVLLPVNFILAPELFKKLIKSITSGSIEIFFKVCSPLASTEAIIKFEVPVTVIFGNLKEFPYKPFLEEISTYPLDREWFAFRLLNPDKW